MARESIHPYIGYSKITPASIPIIDARAPINKTGVLSKELFGHLNACGFFLDHQFARSLRLARSTSLTHYLVDHGFNLGNRAARLLRLDAQSLSEIEVDPELMSFRLFLGHHSTPRTIDNAVSTILVDQNLQQEIALHLATVLPDSQGTPRVVAARYGENGMLTHANVSCTASELPIPSTPQGRERWEFQAARLDGTAEQHHRTAGLITNGMIERTGSHPHVVRFQCTEDSGPRVIPYGLMGITTPVEEAGFSAYQDIAFGQTTFYKGNDWAIQLPTRLQ